jgi:hypothetical protein
MRSKTASPLAQCLIGFVYFYRVKYVLLGSSLLYRISSQNLHVFVLCPEEDFGCPFDQCFYK